MRVLRSRWFSAVLLMIAAGCPRPARADEPAGQPPAPPGAPPPPSAPPLTSVSPPAPSAPPAPSPPPADAPPPPGTPPLPPPGAPPPGTPPPGTPPPPVYWYPPPGYLPPYDMRQIERREHRRTTLPKLVTHKPGMPVYEGYHLEERRPRWPLVAGLPAFGIGYLGSVVIGVVAGGIARDEDNWGPMFIPIVGPFVTLDTAAKTIEFDGERVVIAAMGGFQIAGLAVAALHFLYPPKKMLVLDGKVEVRPASFAGATGLAAHF